jgi:hypothetical protein
MAQDNGMGEILKWGLIIGGGYLLYNYFIAPAATAATTPVTGTTTPPTGTTTTTTGSTTTTPTPGLVIPSTLTVTPGINQSLQGTVQLNGESVQLSIITGRAPATSGVIYNTSGTDITAQFTAAQQAQLVQAFLLAPQTATGTSGLAALKLPVMLTPRGATHPRSARMVGRVGVLS